jgi:two-component system nitrate/nitrite response regulator NarL
LIPNSILWEGLARLLATTEYRPTKCARTIEELLEIPEFNAENALFVISADACTKERDGSNALREVRLLREQYPDAYLIVISNACDVDDVIGTLRAGANGYLQNSMTCDMLTKSFDLVMSGETVLPSEFTRALCQRKNMAPVGEASANGAGNGAIVVEEPARFGVTEMRKLSGREMAIMSRLLEGDSNKSIARRIGLAEATVKTHVKAILRKIGVKNRTQAALWALHNLGAAAVHGQQGAPAPETNLD